MFSQPRLHHQMFSNFPGGSYGGGTDMQATYSTGALPKAGNLPRSDPRSYEGTNLVIPNRDVAIQGMEEQIKGLIIKHVFTSNSFITMRILPLRYTDKNVVTMNSFEYLPTIVAGGLPERGVPRLLSYKKYAAKGVTQRKGLSMFNTVAFLDTAEGAQSRLYLAQELGISIVETMGFDGMNCLVSSAPWTISKEAEAGSYTNEFVKKLEDLQRTFFDIMKKDNNPFSKMNTIITDLMGNYHGRYNTVVIDPRCAMFVTTSIDQKLDVSKAGPGAIAMARNGVKELAQLIPNGVKIYECKSFDVGYGDSIEDNLKVLEMQRQYGEYHILYDPERGQHTGCATDCGIRQMSWMFYDQDNDNMAEITADDVLSLNIRYDGRGNILPHDDPTLTVTEGDYDAADEKADSFTFFKSNGDKTGIRYLGNMYPGNPEKGIKGDMDIMDYQDMAHRAIQTMGHVDTRDGLVAWWSSLQEILETIWAVPHDKKVQEWLDAMLATPSATPVKHPKIEGKGIPPLKDIKEAARNIHGGIDLPDLSAAAATQLNIPLPPYCGSYPQLKTIADIYDREETLVESKYGFKKEYFKKVRDVIAKYDLFMKALDLIAPSVFTSEKYVSSWFLKPNSQTALLSNLAGCGGYPLWYNPTSRFAHGGDAADEAKNKLLEHFNVGFENYNLAITNLKVLQTKVGGGGGAAFKLPAAAAKATEIIKSLTDIYTAMKTIAVPTTVAGVTDATVAALRSLVSNGMRMSVVSALFALPSNYLYQPKRLDESKNDKPITDILIAMQNVITPFLGRLELNTLDEKRAAGGATIVYPKGSFNLDAFPDSDLVTLVSQIGDFVTDKAQQVYNKKAPEEFKTIVLDAIGDLLRKADGYRNDAKRIATDLIKKGGEGAPLDPTKWVRTPLVYNRRQYHEIFNLYYTNKAIIRTVLPSSADDPESIATEVEYQSYAQYLDSSHDSYNATVKPEAVFPAALRIGARINNIRDTMAHMESTSLKKRSQSAAYTDTFFGGELNVGASASGSKKRSRVSKSSVLSFLRGDDSSDIGGYEHEDEDDEVSSKYRKTADLRAVPVTKDFRLSEDLDLDFETNTEGNFEAAFRLTSTGPNDLVRLLSQVYVGMEANMFKIRAAVRNGCLLPFNAIAWQPHQRLPTVDAINCLAGEEMGVTLYGTPKGMAGEDAKAQTKHYTFTWHTAPFIRDPRHIYIARSVMVVGYKGGGGVIPYEKKTYNPLNNQYGPGNQASLFITLIPRGWKGYRGNNSSYMSLTGRRHYLKTKMADPEPLHYPTAAFENRYWGWRANELGERPANDGGDYVQSQVTPNVMCGEGLTFYWSTLRGKYAYYRRSNSHWQTEHTFPGCKDTREGKLTAYPRKANYDAKYDPAP